VNDCQKLGRREAEIEGLRQAAIGDNRPLFMCKQVDASYNRKYSLTIECVLNRPLSACKQGNAGCDLLRVAQGIRGNFGRHLHKSVHIL